MTRRRNPRSGLTALLDALERELLWASADDVRDALSAAGRACNVACQEVRGVLNEAIVASENGSAVPPPPYICARAGLYRH